MRLNAKRKRSAYRTELEYIRAVYLHNKKKIAKNISPEWVEANNGNVYQAFKELVQSQMKYTNPKTNKNYTALEAIKRESRSMDLNKNWSIGDIYGRNFHSLVSEHKELKKEFYQHEGINRYNPIDYSKYSFEGYYHYKGKQVLLYRYGDTYFVESQSPDAKTGASLEIFSGSKYYELTRTNALRLEQKRRGK